MKVCVLSSGSKGNSTYVETKSHKILIDIGNSCLYIEKSLRSINVDPKEIDILLVTHSHVDHVSGIKVFCKKYNPLVYISDITKKEANLEIEGISSEQLIDGDMKINSIKLSHDVGEVRGYIIEELNSSLVYITDTGYINERYYDLLKNKTMYVFESNHDIEKLMNNPHYPHYTKIRILSDKGHLSNKDSSYYLSKLVGNKTKIIALAHLSEENNTSSLAIDTLEQTLKAKNISVPKIIIAKQNDITDIFDI